MLQSQYAFYEGTNLGMVCVRIGKDYREIVDSTCLYYIQET